MTGLSWRRGDNPSRAPPWPRLPCHGRDTTRVRNAAVCLSVELSTYHYVLLCCFSFTVFFISIAIFLFLLIYFFSLVFSPFPFFLLVFFSFVSYYVIFTLFSFPLRHSFSFSNLLSLFFLSFLFYLCTFPYSHYVIFHSQFVFISLTFS